MPADWKMNIMYLLFSDGTRIIKSRATLAFF